MPPGAKSFGPGMTFVFNPMFFSELDQDQDVRQQVAESAQDALLHAEAIGEGLGSPGTGDYAASISVDGPYLVTTDPAGWIIEFGSVNNPPYGPLRKAAEAVGARLVEGSDFPGR